MFPGLRHLDSNPQALEQVLRMAQTGQFDEIRSTAGAYWQRHATNLAQTAAEKFATAVGSTPDKLPANFTRQMAGMMMRFIEEDTTGVRAQRFEAGDPKLIDEVVADAQAMWVNPFRVAQNNDAARTVERNRGLPQRGPAGAPGPQAGGPGGQKKSREEIRAGARAFVRANMGGGG